VLRPQPTLAAQRRPPTVALVCAQIKELHPKTTPQQLMCYMNVWCTVYYALYMFSYSRESRRLLCRTSSQAHNTHVRRDRDFQLEGAGV
jgi:hypothetical protein